MVRMNRNESQGYYWILTIPEDKYEVPEVCPEAIQWMKGQKELGESGYRHWQFIIALKKKARFISVKRLFPVEAHIELTRSKAAEAYVCKEETRIEGSGFELGERKMKLNSKIDWAKQKELAVAGKLDEVDPGVFIRCYVSLQRIKTEHCRPVFRDVQEVKVFWGVSGSGKTKRVFEEAGEEFYIKSSTTKWFDGYRGEENIIIDEFTGTMDIVHLLKWLDMYPLTVEVKGGQVVLKSKRWWITSNVDPKDWYSDERATDEQKKALRRRFSEVIHFTEPYGGLLNHW